MREPQSRDDRGVLLAHSLAVGEPEMFDEEATQPDRPWPGDAIAAFHRALGAVEAKRNDLAVALQMAYPLEIEIAASDLVAACLSIAAATKTIYLRVIEAEAHQSAALHALRLSRDEISGLFARCSNHLSPAADIPSLRDNLCRLALRIEHAFQSAEASHVDASTRTPLSTHETSKGIE